jgi:hypothetical protein
VTLDEMVAEVQAHGFSMTTSARITRWLNEAYTTIVRKSRLASFEATTDLAFVAGTPNQNLPATTLSILGVVDRTSNGRPLGRITGALADTQTSVGPGAPQAYYLQGNQLYLFPTPNASYTVRVRYLSQPTALTAGTDQPALPTYYHDALVAYAISRAYRSEDDPQQAIAFMADFDRRTAEMIVAMRAENIDGPLQVPGMWKGIPSSPWGS